MFERIAQSAGLRVRRFAAKSHSGPAESATAVQRVRRASPAPSSLRFFASLAPFGGHSNSPQRGARRAWGASARANCPERRPQGLALRGETALETCWTCNRGSTHTPCVAYPIIAPFFCDSCAFWRPFKLAAKRHKTRMGGQCSSKSPNATTSGFGPSRRNRAQDVLDLQPRFNAYAVPRLPHHRSAFLRLLRLLAALKLVRENPSRGCCAGNQPTG